MIWIEVYDDGTLRCGAPIDVKALFIQQESTILSRIETLPCHEMKFGWMNIYALELHWGIIGLETSDGRLLFCGFR